MNPFSEVTSFLDGAIAVAVVLIGVSLLLTFVRLIKGPSLADRVVALDLLTVLAMGVIGLRVIATGDVLYLEIALALGLVAFLATVFFARLIETRGRELDHGYDTADRAKER
jgi:multicomponent Na+:H+ antiporter subunit F